MGESIEKRFLFFEHKGTRIFETRKPLFEKKPHIPCFLNYQPILTNKTLLFLDKPSLYGLSHIINVLILCVLAGLDPQSHTSFM